MSKGSVLLDIKWEVDDKVSAFQEALTDYNVINIAEDANPNSKDIRFAVVWKPEPGLLASLPDLEVIFSLGAGVDHLTSDPHLPDLPIVRFVDPDLTGRMVEYVVLQVLMHLRQQRRYDRFQHDHKWIELSQPAAHQMRVGIMGFGELGQATAAGLLPLGFQLSGWSRSKKQMDGVTCWHGEEGLPPFLAETDILVCLLPYTVDTHGILNRVLFEQLSRRGPFGAPVVINAGRGGSQVEADIVSCLNDGTLHGVSLDVFEVEPLAKESPLWDFDNAILTPHMAAVSDPTALARYVSAQIIRYDQTGELHNLIDRQQGY